MEAYRQKSWFGRNWPWVLPLGGCLGLILLVVFGIGAAIFGVSNLITNSEPYNYAIEHASTNESAIAALGENIETDGIMQGNISLDNDDGEVDITIPIKGDEAKGSVSVIGKKTDGTWHYEKLYVTIKATSEKINLLDKEVESF